ncbi:T9SS type A sorting domain-containing protein [Haloflavibacter putidus]|uniref:T9SS type A sorting domain-containing protein n=1 Tax=Haloflavibacter putidus TaxID=2576776 RepID=A0A507ZII7_9FLAO|nr:T9SS type A sorting domain-containing protein [Haloflavibacter putidus]TQD36999.1 T9SS type A sorting domain-containing protein [Haloflavibacter putidus]
MKLLLFFLTVLASTTCYAQFNPIQLIDNDVTSGGIKHIYASDLNNDGLKEVIVAKAYNFDNITVYQNQGNGNFTENIIGTLSEAEYVTSADLNENGFQDLIALMQSNGNLVWYPNTNGNFGSAIAIDNEASFGKSIVTADFNNDSHTDLVVIWQHAINFYENDGLGNFTKDAILTTTTSPTILECWTLTKADINNDGNIDVITGETIGGVIYINDGNANFTPQTFTNGSHSTITSLDFFDANNDTFLDAVLHRATGDISLYLNAGNNLMNFNFHADLMEVNSSLALQSADVNNDGNVDLYMAFNGKPRVFLNDGNLSFANEIILDDNETIFVNEVLVTNLDNAMQQAFIWSGANTTLAYQTYGNLAVENFMHSESTLFPNPATEFIQLKQEQSQFVKASIFTVDGKLVKREFALKPANKIDVSFLSPGLYILKTSTDSGKNNYLKFIKE